MEPAPDAVRPRGSVGTSELDEEHGNAANKPEAAKSGEAKNRQTQSPPTANVTVARPRRNVNNLTVRHPARLCRSAPCHGNADSHIVDYSLVMGGSRNDEMISARAGLSVPFPVWCHHQNSATPVQ